MKASAIAHPIQGLVKSHGLTDDKPRLPSHDSISVSLAPLKTHTTIEFGNFETDRATIDGLEVLGRDLERIAGLVDTIRFQAKCSLRFRVMSMNNFPKDVGFRSSASVFASLALATCRALDLHLELRDVSKLAMGGSSSAAQSVTGGFSRLKMGLSDDDSYSYQIASEKLQMGIIVSIVPNVPDYKQAEGVHKYALPSPYLPSMVMEAAKLVEEMELAIREGDIGRICSLAEKDALMLHGITMTGVGELLVWHPETLRLIHAVRNMRDDGMSAFFSVERGGAVYINTFPDRIDEVERRIRDLGIYYWICSVGEEAKITEDHLF